MYLGDIKQEIKLAMPLLESDDTIKKFIPTIEQAIKDNCDQNELKDLYQYLILPNAAILFTYDGKDIVTDCKVVMRYNHDYDLHEHKTFTKKDKTNFSIKITNMLRQYKEFNDSILAVFNDFVILFESVDSTDERISNDMISDKNNRDQKFLITTPLCWAHLYDVTEDED